MHKKRKLTHSPEEEVQEGKLHPDVKALLDLEDAHALAAEKKRVKQMRRREQRQEIIVCLYCALPYFTAKAIWGLGEGSI